MRELGADRLRHLSRHRRDLGHAHLRVGVAGLQDIQGADGVEVMMAGDGSGEPLDPSWLVFDARYRARYPAGPVIPNIPDFALPSGVRKVLVKASTLEGLARGMGVPAEAFQATVARFNTLAAAGKDEDFGRGDSNYDRLYGDPRVTPNPSLGTVAKPPFYALPLHLGDIGTSGGLVTDDRARDRDGGVIAGLYATGNVTGSVMGYAYPGAGSTLGPAMTFGYVAAGDALGLNSEG